VDKVKKIEKGFLEKKYLDEKLSCKKIAGLCNMNPKTVWRWLKRLNIQTRSRREAAILVHGKRKKKVSYEEELRAELNRIAVLEAEEAEGKALAEQIRFDTHQMSLDERIDYLKRQEELKEQKKVEEDEKRKRLYAEDQIRLKKELKETSSTLEGTAKEQMDKIQEACDDLSGYKK